MNLIAGAPLTQKPPRFPSTALAVAFCIEVRSVERCSNAVPLLIWTHASIRRPCVSSVSGQRSPMIDDPKRLRREVTAWERRRNAAHSRIKWMFTTDKARANLGRAYPPTSKES